jgi:hypothetical protein
MTEAAAGAAPVVPRGPTHGAVILFITAVVTTVILVTGGTWYAVVSANGQISLERRQLALQQQQLVVQRKQVQESCGFWRDLAGIPITATPPARVPSLLGVTIILSALQAYDGPLCGRLNPTPSLARWSRYYRLTLP